MRGKWRINKRRRATRMQQTSNGMGTCAVAHDKPPLLKYRLFNPAELTVPAIPPASLYVLLLCLCPPEAWLFVLLLVFLLVRRLCILVSELYLCFSLQASTRGSVRPLPGIRLINGPRKSREKLLTLPLHGQLVSEATRLRLAGPGEKPGANERFLFPAFFRDLFLAISEAWTGGIRRCAFRVKILGHELVPFFHSLSTRRILFLPVGRRRVLFILRAVADRASGIARFPLPWNSHVAASITRILVSTVSLRV